MHEHLVLQPNVYMLQACDLFVQIHATGDRTSATTTKLLGEY